MELCVGFCLLIVGSAVFFFVYFSIAVSGARTAYRRALDDLTRSPNSPKLRQTALLLGRAFVQVSKSANKRGYRCPVIDELMIQNDLMAAAAAAGRGSEPERPPPLRIEQIPVAQLSESPEDRMDKLNRLLRAGVITKQEYTAKRAEIVREL